MAANYNSHHGPSPQGVRVSQGRRGPAQQGYTVHNGGYMVPGVPGYAPVFAYPGAGGNVFYGYPGVPGSRPMHAPQYRPQYAVAQQPQYALAPQFSPQGHPQGHVMPGVPPVQQGGRRPHGPQTVQPQSAVAPVGAMSRLQLQPRAVEAPTQQPGDDAPFYSIDVECVATGPQHNQRSVAQISLVDQHEQVLLNLYIKQDKPVASYIHALTGLTPEQLDAGIELEEAMRQIRAVLPKESVLVGQNILKDVTWLKLEEGKDFAGMQDLAGLWRVFNKKYKNYSMFSLHHKAKALLHIVQQEPHNAATDAILSIRLYKLHTSLSKDPASLDEANQLLLNTPIDDSFAKRNPTYEGVCMGMKKTCKCGAPFFY
mmetsp:Transcript_19332/g.21640  ORF Transcript_19332/g.21640 Transcript_19332/m.21640 type:complete len:370 (-) Transcript_19332:58-1167(-)|eukprot:CAMPEP_0205819088 /NCGR_PEP_ID=MMETSP0206-20130828/1291_1 /ASSEMBLY_ACC=CAM_ASM_000279 /TAXON_ID=36767 /ORGANISM="Euplotes focardii, Strain TN1" /LENGTH=369 /DNA_ID=CAMNT_0053112209 /DNA_START=20 /DNA_END=1129 /DNA_ORIENTATION=-